MENVRNDHASETWLLWAIFLVLDFPASIIVLVTSGPCVVGIPVWLDELWHNPPGTHHLLLHDVLWPGLVFQFVGTVNWTILLWLYFWLYKNKNQPAE
jgi:hypothetical protein